MNFILLMTTLLTLGACQDKSDSRSAAAQIPPPVNGPFEPLPGENPAGSSPQTPITLPGPDLQPTHSIFKFRSFDGVGNNLINPVRGSAGSILIRRTEARYADGVGAPSGETRPNPRSVSNAVHAQQNPIPNSDGLTDMFWAWGQFVDHDMGLTNTDENSEDWPISIPDNDPFFTEESQLEFKRSIHLEVNGLREQATRVTAFIDGSVIYGSSANRATALRRLDGSGKMKTSDGSLLPFNTEGLPNQGGNDNTSLFLGGDYRANENPALLSLNILFVREHNRLVDEIKSQNPALKGESLYQMARAVVGGLIARITYEEFLPLVLGESLPAYQGYDDQINPGLANEFSTVAFRFGHSGISPTLALVDQALQVTDQLPLSSVFFRPDLLVSNGIEPFLRGLSTQVSQQIDVQVVTALRDIPASPNSSARDLVASDLARGRDHGLGSYNDLRQQLGLAPISEVGDISADPATKDRLTEFYSSVSQIDPLSGGLAEDHLAGAQVGSLFHKIIKDQFMRLRGGDRFWYESHLPIVWRDWVNTQTLAKVIRRNTGIDTELADNVFKAP